MVMDPRRMVTGLARIPRGRSVMGGYARLVETIPQTQHAPGSATFLIQKATDASSLARAITGSKAAAARVLANRQLRRADGGPFLPRGQVIRGEKVVLQLEHGGSVEHPVAAPVTVLYEDVFLLAVEKPASILVHTDGTEAETLAGRVLAYLRAKSVDAAPQALHRLDFKTTGIVLFSLASETQPAFDALVAGGALEKRYYALVEGRFPGVAGKGWLSVDAPIGRDRHNSRRMRVASSGKPATTRFRVVERRGQQTLVEAELQSGRRHQIRVHLAHLGCPIVGDDLYGNAKSDEQLHLHAHEVRLMHPLTGKRIELESPCPW